MENIEKDGFDYEKIEETYESFMKLFLINQIET